MGAVSSLEKPGVSGIPGLEGGFYSMVYGVKNRFFLEKPDFQLGWMYVHVHGLARYPNMQNTGGKLPTMMDPLTACSTAAAAVRLLTHRPLIKNICILRLGRAADGLLTNPWTVI